MTYEITTGLIDAYVVTFCGVTEERGINYERIRIAAGYEHINEARMIEIAESSTEDLSLRDLVALANE